MNYINKALLKKANEDAIFNVYMYLAHKTIPAPKETFKSIVRTLEEDFKNPFTEVWSEREIFRLKILKSAVRTDSIIANSVIDNLTVSKSFMTACTFTKPDKRVSVIFKGTGSGEWIDNGEGLSGISEENTYIFYTKNAKEAGRKTIYNDYATDAQVGALNWFNMTAARCGWNKATSITLSGHSKGGNKAQFIAINSDLADCCFSFDGQGFSPEALSALKQKHAAKYEKRRQRIYSFAAENDYVSVLGEPLVQESNRYYFKSRGGVHYMEAILTGGGKFRRQCEQGIASEYVQGISRSLMQRPPILRRYVTIGAMNLFQKDLEEEIPKT